MPRHPAPGGARGRAAGTTPPAAHQDLTAGPPAPTYPSVCPGKPAAAAAGCSSTSCWFTNVRGCTPNRTGNDSDARSPDEPGIGAKSAASAKTEQPGRWLEAHDAPPPADPVTVAEASLRQLQHELA